MLKLDFTVHRPLLAIVGVFVLFGCSSQPVNRQSTGQPRSSSKESLEEAIVQDRPEVVEQLVKSGTDVNAANNKGETPLHIAAQYSRLNIARSLIQNGAKVNAKTADGSTPLGYSISMGRGQLVELLLDKGADPNAHAPGEWSPLHWAIGTQDDSLVKLLLDKGANPNTIDDGRPVVYTAAASGTKVALELLVEHGADPNARTKGGGETPIFAALVHGTGMLEVLVKRGADLNAKNKKGQTPLDAALKIAKTPDAEQWYPRLDDAIKFLRSKGAKTSQVKL